MIQVPMIEIKEIVLPNIRLGYLRCMEIFLKFRIWFLKFQLVVLSKWQMYGVSAHPSLSGRSDDASQM